MPNRANLAQFSEKILAKLSAALLAFDHEGLLYANESAKTLLQLPPSGELGPYAAGLRDLLALNIDGYSRVLSDLPSKPLVCNLHLMGDLQVIEASEAAEGRLGEVSHELRRPLTNVKSLVDTLYLWGAGEDPAVRPKFLGQLHSEVERLTKLLNELLDLSRMQAGSVPLHYKQISLYALVEAAISVLAEQAAKANVELKNEIPPEFVLVADLDKVERIVENLIENGIRYNKAGGKVTARVNAAQENSFSVEDTGIGIAEGNMKIIFERFKRINKSIPGTGLGLSIVKTMVDLHNGSILVSSKEGVGTTFTVTLPTKKLAAAPL